MMLDQDVAAVSPATVHRVLSAAGRLDKWKRGPSKKGTGFVQPLAPHEHWHVDIAYLNVAGTFYDRCSLPNGASRAIVHWEIREAMTERDVEPIVQRACEKHPDARPRIISGRPRQGHLGRARSQAGGRAGAAPPAPLREAGSGSFMRLPWARARRRGLVLRDEHRAGLDAMVIEAPRRRGAAVNFTHPTFYVTVTPRRPVLGEPVQPEPYDVEQLSAAAASGAPVERLLFCRPRV